MGINLDTSGKVKGLYEKKVWGRTWVEFIINLLSTENPKRTIEKYQTWLKKYIHINND